MWLGGERNIRQEATRAQIQSGWQSEIQSDYVVQASSLIIGRDRFAPSSEE